MWDEAGQKLRAVLDPQRSLTTNGSAGAQTTLQVMTSSCNLFCVVLKEDVRTGGHVSVERWEPWLTPMRVLEGMHEQHSRGIGLESAVLHGLGPPLSGTGPPSMRRLGPRIHLRLRLVEHPGCQVVLGASLQVGVEARNVRHVHIITSSNLESFGMSAIVHSWICLLRLDSSLAALQASLRHAVKSKLVIRCGNRCPSTSNTFMSVVRVVFNIGGGEEYLFKIRPDGSKLPAAFYESMLHLSEACEFTPAGDIIVYTGDFPGTARHN